MQMYILQINCCTDDNNPIKNLRLNDKGIIYQSQNCEVIRKDQENQTYSTWLFIKLVTEAVPGVFS